jgi:two-component system response regulator AtoC
VERSGRNTPQSAARSRFRVLVVDDAEGIRSYLASFLELRGYDVDTVEDGRRALAFLEGGAAPDVIILDVMMPGMGGIETLRRIRQQDEHVPVVMLSVVGKAATIVEAMELGAVDYLNKPFAEDELLAVLSRALEKRALELAREQLAQASDLSTEQMVWASESMRRVRATLEQVSDTDVTILIRGESGVGKELVARAAHDIGARAKRPFVKVNCAALPEPLLESELFGYEKGAFTGAGARKTGKFELAHKGTIFLDEIGEMSPALQAKLLQVLQDHQFTRLGGNEDVSVDVRVVCATHRPLEEMVRQQKFREDLFFRLNVVSVAIPPLRERREEIPFLVESFLRRFSARYRKNLRQPSQALMRACESYAFPGNVRELENMIKRIVVLDSEHPILAEIARARQRQGGVARGSDALLALIGEIETRAGEIPLREVGRLVAQAAEKSAIAQVLDHTGWNRKAASKLLGVSYKTLLQKIRDCGLEPDAP